MASNFGNITLDIIATNHSPFNVRKNGSWTGIFIELIEIMAKSLNFKYIIHNQADKIWGMDVGNGSHNGMVGVVQRGEADLGLGVFTVTPSRTGAVDYAYPLVFGKYLMYLKKPLATDYLYFIYPFKAYTWLAMLSTIMLITALSIFATSCFKHHVTSVLWSDSPNWPNAWTFWRSIVLQPAYSSRPRTITHHVLLLAWWLMTVILVAFYTSALTSTLAVRKVTLPVNSVKELAESSMTVVVVHYTAMENFLAAATDGPLKTIYDRIIKEDSFGRDAAEVQEIVLSHPNTIGIDYMAIVQGITSCDHSVIDEAVYGTRDSLIVPKNSPYLDGINQVLYRLVETGVYGRILRKYKPTGNNCGDRRRESQQPLGMDVICGVFYVLGGGMAMAVIWLIREIAMYCQRKSSEKTQNSGNKEVYQISGHSEIYQAGGIREMSQNGGNEVTNKGGGNGEIYQIEGIRDAPEWRTYGNASEWDNYVDLSGWRNK